MGSVTLDSLSGLHGCPIKISAMLPDIISEGAGLLVSLIIALVRGVTGISNKGLQDGTD